MGRPIVLMIEGCSPHACILTLRTIRSNRGQGKSAHESVDNPAAGRDRRKPAVTTVRISAARRDWWSRNSCQRHVNPCAPVWRGLGRCKPVNDGRCRNGKCV